MGSREHPGGQKSDSKRVKAPVPALSPITQPCNSLRGHGPSSLGLMVLWGLEVDPPLLAPLVYPSTSEIFLSLAGQVSNRLYLCCLPKSLADLLIHDPPPSVIENTAEVGWAGNRNPPPPTQESHIPNRSCKMEFDTW